MSVTNVHEPDAKLLAFASGDRGDIDLAKDTPPGAARFLAVRGRGRRRARATAGVERLADGLLAHRR